MVPSTPAAAPSVFALRRSAVKQDVVAAGGPPSDARPTQLSLWWLEHRLKVVVALQTAFGLTEDALDGVPIPGIKAVFSFAGKALETLRVRVDRLWAILRTNPPVDCQSVWSNVDTIRDLAEELKRLMVSLNQEPKDVDGKVMLSEGLKKLVHELKACVHLAPTVRRDVAESRSELMEHEREWMSKQQRSSWSRFYNAKEIGDDLTDLRRKVSGSIQTFMVCRFPYSLHYPANYADLLSS